MLTTPQYLLPLSIETSRCIRCRYPDAKRMPYPSCSRTIRIIICPSNCHNYSDSKPYRICFPINQPTTLATTSLQSYHKRYNQALYETRKSTRNGGKAYTILSTHLRFLPPNMLLPMRRSHPRALLQIPHRFVWVPSPRRCSWCVCCAAAARGVALFDVVDAGGSEGVGEVL